jgi:hypothetical protein
MMFFLLMRHRSAMLHDGKSGQRALRLKLKIVVLHVQRDLLARVEVAEVAVVLNLDDPP